MKIETEFKVNEECWTIYENRIVKGEVKFIKIFVSDKASTLTYNLLLFNNVEKEKLENQVAKTPEELAKRITIE